MAKGYVNQHIVPKRYLDRFGIKKGRATIIGTRIVKNGEPKYFIRSTDNVGYIKNYYDVTDKDDPKYWEHYLAKEIDTLCGREMKNIIAKATLSQKNAFVLSEKDKEVLSKVIIAQLLRIPNNIDYVCGQFYQQNKKQIKEEILAALPHAIREKYEKKLKNSDPPKQYLKEIYLDHVFSSGSFKRYCGVLQAGIWVLYVNLHRDTMPFYTSDNPVLVEGSENAQTGLFHNGLAKPATRIFYPLNPRMAVAIYHKNGILGMAAKENNGKMILLDDLEFIRDKNRKITDQAFRNPFFPQPIIDEIIKNTKQSSIKQEEN